MDNGGTGMGNGIRFDHMVFHIGFTEDFSIAPIAFPLVIDFADGFFFDGMDISDIQNILNLF